MLQKEELAKKWHIGLKTAEQTLKVTTQKGTRNLLHPLHKRAKMRPYLSKPIAKGQWYSDTMFFKHTSVMRQEKAAQVTTNGKFTHFFPIVRKANCSDALMNFIHTIGIPEQIVTDGAKEEGAFDTYGANWNKVVKRYNIRQTWIQPYCWFQNSAEAEISQIRMDIRWNTRQKNSPQQLWAFCGALCVGRRNRTAKDKNMGRTGFEVAKGYTPDITLYLEHEWYELVYWFDSKEKEMQMGRWLGPCGDDFGAGDCYYILAKSGKIHVTNTTQKIPEEDLKTDDKKTEVKWFDESIHARIGDKVKDGFHWMEEEYPDPGGPIRRGGRGFYAC